MSAISAATKASEIVFADYTKKFLRKWLDGEPDAFDWSPYFSHVVVNLEGKEEEEARKIEGQVRKLVRATVHCDINQDPPIERGFDDLYDVVMVSLVLEGTARSQEGYCSSLSRLARLVKPGGAIFYYGVENKFCYYTVGDRSFPAVYVDDQLTMSAFVDAGFGDVTLTKAPKFDPVVSFRFVKGTRL